MTGGGLQSRAERTLEAAEELLAVLRAHGIEALLIGATAMAVHHYVRSTEDLDFAVAVDPKRLEPLAAALRGRGYEVELREPDADDPLGGVLDVRAPDADLIQVVNFDNPPASGFPRLVTDALRHSSELAPGSALRVVGLPHLIVFKLYAGGRKSAVDVLELLERNPQLDRAHLRALCDGYRLGRELDAVLRLEQSGS